LSALIRRRSSDRRSPHSEIRDDDVGQLAVHDLERLLAVAGS